MYIDDDPAHWDEENNRGKIIEDFRYVLYVDDKLVKMDSTIDTQGGANGSVGEYALPYTFSLKAGNNKIRLGMAGGYRSVFYNFTFLKVLN